MVVPDPAGPGGERVKLLDFGIAKLGASHVQGEDVKTRTGQIMGTAAYMSPEQFGGHKPTDGQSDVYSLGCLMFRMLTGQQPFVSDSGEMAVAAMHMFKPAPPLQTLVPEAMPWLVNLIDSMLRKEPDQRPTMAEVATILQDELPDHAQSRKSLPPFRMEVSGATHMSNIQGAPARLPPARATPGEVIAVSGEQPVLRASNSYPGSITGASGEAAQLLPRRSRRPYAVVAAGLALVVAASGGTLLLLRSRIIPHHVINQPASPAVTPPPTEPPAPPVKAAPPPAVSAPPPTPDKPPAVAPTTPPAAPDGDPADTDPDAKARRDRAANKLGKPGRLGGRGDGRSRSKTSHATQIIN